MESVTQPVESPTNEEIDEKIDVSNIKIEVSENFNPNTPDELDLSPFVCGVCYSKFTNFEFYVDHLKSHDDVAHLLGPDVINFTIRNETALTYACVKCNTSFPSISEIEKHLLEVECSSDFIISGRTRKAYLVSDTTLSWLDEVLHNDTFGRKWSELGQQADDARNDEHLTLAQEKNGKRAKSKKTSIKKTKSRPEKTKGKDKMPLKINLRKKQAVKARTPRLKIRIENVSHDNTMDIETNSVSTKDEGQTLSQKSVSDNKAALYDNTFNSSTLKEVDDTHDDNVSIDQGEETGSDAATEELQMDTEDATVQSKIKTETATKTVDDFFPVEMNVSLIEKDMSVSVINKADISGNISLNQDVDPMQQGDKHTNAVQTPSKTSDTIFTCSDCTYTSRFQRNIRRHRQSLHLKKKYICETCSKAYASMYDLGEHIRTQHGNEKLLCEVCSKTFLSRKSLSRHKMTIHASTPKYQCSYCGKGFQDKDCFNGHVNSHTKSKPFECKTCSKTFAYTSSLRIHAKDCGGDKQSKSCTYSCDHCEKVLSSSRALRDHVNGKHGPKILLCACGKAFSWRTGLFRHQKTCPITK